MIRAATTRGRSARRLSAIALVAAIGSFAATSVAADAEPHVRLVQIDRSACDSPALRDVPAILRVELLNRVVEGPPRGGAYRTAFDCSGSLVAISVGAPGGATRTVQTNLGGVPVNVHARIVALAIAELVRSLDEEAPPAASVPVGPHSVLAPTARVEPRERPAEPAPPARVPRPRAVDLEPFAQTASFQLNGVWLAGGGLRVDYVYRRLALGLDFAFLTTSEHFDLGAAQVLLGYASPTLAWQERWGRAQTRLGGGYAIGAATLSGRASEPRAFDGTTTGPWSAPYAFAGLAVVLTDALFVEARGQVGWVTSPVVGEVAGGADVALQGLWASAEIGVAIAL